MWGWGTYTQTNKQTQKQTHRHINTTTRPDPGAEPSDKYVYMTQFQMEGGGVAQGVTKLILTFSAFVT